MVNLQIIQVQEMFVIALQEDKTLIEISRHERKENAKQEAISLLSRLMLQVQGL